MIQIYAAIVATTLKTIMYSMSNLVSCLVLKSEARYRFSGAPNAAWARMAPAIAIAAHVRLGFAHS